jgi:hypothetical protein
MSELESPVHPAFKNPDQKSVTDIIDEAQSEQRQQQESARNKVTKAEFEAFNRSKRPAAPPMTPDQVRKSFP